MGRRTRSKVWDFFTKQKDCAKCNLCLQVIHNNNNTTNLRKHLEAKHSGHILQPVDEIQNEIEEQNSEFVDNDLEELPSSSSSGTSSSKRKSSETDATPLQSIKRFASAPTVSPTLFQATTNTPTLMTSRSSASQSSLISEPAKTNAESSNKKGSARSTSVKKAFDLMNSYAEGGARHAAVSNAILFFIAKDYQPLSVVEDEGFLKLMKTCVPNYKVPSRQTVTRNLDDKYTTLKETMREDLGKKKNVTLTTDIWTENYTKRSYLSLTMHYYDTSEAKMKSVTLGVRELLEHHTAEEIGKHLRQFCDDFKILKENVVCIVTDNGSNIVKAAHKEFGKNKHLACVAHCLNLVVDKGIKGIKEGEQRDRQVAIDSPVSDLVRQVRKIVTYFKQSSPAMLALNKHQSNDEERKNDILKPLQDVETRWNSIFYMIHRFLTLKTFIGYALSEAASAPDMLLSQEIMQLNEIMDCLKPFEEATNIASGETYGTAGQVIPLVNMIRGVLETSCNVNSDVAENFRKLLLYNLNERFKFIEQVYLLSCATILDPRYKRLHFSNPMFAAQAVKVISNEMRGNKDTQTQAKKLARPKSTAPQMSLFSYHEQLVKKEGEGSVYDEPGGVPSELRTYLTKPVESIETDPLEYWEKHKLLSPKLYAVGIKYAAILGTSVPSERLFSKAGTLICKKRSRLSSKRLSSLLFLNGISMEEWFK